MSDDSGTGAFTQATGRTLEDASGTHQRRYRAYQFDLIARHCGPSVLEVGAGPRRVRQPVHAASTGSWSPTSTPTACGRWRDRFADRPEVEARQLDLQGSAIPPIGAPVVDRGRGQRPRAHRGGQRGAAVAGQAGRARRQHRAVGAGLHAALRRLRPARSATSAATPRRPCGPRSWAPGWSASEVAGQPARRRRLVAGRPSGRGRRTRTRGCCRIYDRTVVPVTRTVERWVTPPFGQSVLAVASVPVDGAASA